MSRKSDALHIKLSKIVGADRVRSDNMERLLHSHDLAPLPKMMEFGFRMQPDAVVRPKNAKEISEIVKFAIKEQVPLVPRGGASWGFGGAVPVEGGIVLDMTSMNDIIRMDVANLEVEVGAGATWKKVHDEALKAGLFIGYYPSSAPAATIAGWIATGGLGIGSYKYGSVVANVRNMEVVLPEGQIINTGFNYVSDHSSGYNLNSLLVGSEGTLGLVTKVTLKAVPAPEVIKPVSVMFATLKDVFPMMHEITRKRINPLHVSFVDENHTRYLKEVGRHSPGDGAVLNIVLEGDRESVEWEEKVISGLITKHGGKRLSDEEAQHEWEENPYELRVREVGVSAALAEVVIPITEFEAVIGEMYKLIKGMKMDGEEVRQVHGVPRLRQEGGRPRDEAQGPAPGLRPVLRPEPQEDQGEGRQRDVRHQDRLGSPRRCQPRQDVRGPDPLRDAHARGHDERGHERDGGNEEGPAQGQGLQEGRRQVRGKAPPPL
jgi:glycolate oxidase